MLQLMYWVYACPLEIFGWYLYKYIQSLTHCLKCTSNKDRGQWFLFTSAKFHTDTKNGRHYMLWTDYCLLPLIIWERLNFNYHNRWFLGFPFPDLYLFLCTVREMGPKMAYHFYACTQVHLRLNNSLLYIHALLE